MKLYLARHGETDWNVQDLLQGWSNIPLNETGIAQAKSLHDMATARGLEFDAVYSSPLDRTRKTAEIISPDREIITDSRLVERGAGLFEGKPCQQFYDSPIDFLDPGLNSSGYSVEPILDFSSRIANFLTEISHKYPENAKILIATSSGVMKRTYILTTGRYDPPNYQNGEIYECALPKNAHFTLKMPQNG